MRIVLDTAAMVAALLRSCPDPRGASQGCWSVGVRCPVSDVGAVLDAVAAVAVPVTLDFSWRPVTPDPDDDMALETAVNGRADAIATFNVRDLAAAAKHFGLAAARPGEILALWEKKT